MMTVEIEAYSHDERMSDDGGEAEADHEGRWKHSTLILLLFVQEIGGNRRDGGRGLKDVFFSMIRMSEDGGGVEAEYHE